MSWLYLFAWNSDISCYFKANKELLLLTENIICGIFYNKYNGEKTMTSFINAYIQTNNVIPAVVITIDKWFICGVIKNKFA